MVGVGFEKSGEFFRVEAIGAFAALINDFSICGQDIQAFGPAVERDVRPIIRRVQNGRNGQAQADHAGVGDFAPIRFRIRLRVQNLLFHIRLHLPAIGGMRFADVDHIEIGLRAIVMINFFQADRLTPKRGSRIAAEDQHGWQDRVGRTDFNG